MEACYSSHYWARCFEDSGHRSRLLPAQHVAPFVRGNKSDHNDAIAIAEASKRPNIIDVPEGMLGSGAGAGWIKRGLPTVAMN